MSTRRRALVALAVASVLAVGGWTLLADQKPVEKPPEVPPELGKVPFLRDYAAAVAKAKADKKPLFVLFDEVPGCDTCKLFGKGPLSHPAIVATATHEFVPVAVANNLPGKDAEVLKKFDEPAWNNPVMRFLAADETDLIPRKADIYHGGIVLSRMAEALAKAKRPVPTYLKLAVAEFNPKTPETAVFAMRCYWEGEAKLGALEGVLATRIGELEGAEVVEVTYDAAVVDYKTLVEMAAVLECTHKVFARTPAQLKTATDVVGKKAVRSVKEIDARTQQQYHLSHSPRYHYLPLTATQASRVNAALANDKNPDEFLSPLQLEMYQRFTKTTEAQAKLLAKLKPDRSPVGVIAYWAEVEKVLAK